MIGMSSRTSKMSRHAWHTSSFSSGRYSSSPLHLGQTRISSNSASSIVYLRLRQRIVDRRRSTLATRSALRLRRDRIPQPLQSRAVPPPARQRLHPQVQIDSGTDEGLDLRPRVLPQLPDGGAFLADQDRLLTVPLDVDDGADVDRILRLPELLDRDRRAVRDLLAVRLEDRLPDQLGDEEADGLDGEIVLRVEEPRDRQRTDQCGPELIDAFPSERRDLERVQIELRARPSAQRFDPARSRCVDLVDRHER